MILRGYKSREIKSTAIWPLRRMYVYTYIYICIHFSVCNGSCIDACSYASRCLLAQPHGRHVLCTFAYGYVVQCSMIVIIALYYNARFHFLSGEWSVSRNCMLTTARVHGLILHDSVVLQRSFPSSFYSVDTLSLIHI